MEMSLLSSLYALSQFEDLVSIHLRSSKEIGRCACTTCALNVPKNKDSIPDEMNLLKNLAFLNTKPPQAQ